MVQNILKGHETCKKYDLGVLLGVYALRLNFLIHVLLPSTPHFKGCDSPLQTGGGGKMIRICYHRIQHIYFIKRIQYMFRPYFFEAEKCLV